MVLTIFDLLSTPFYLIIIYFLSSYTQKKNVGTNPLYKYYTKGLFVKLLGAISVCLIYQYYYTGGDTTNYYDTAKAIWNLTGKNLSVFFDIMSGNNSKENYSYFDASTGFPVYWRDDKSLFVGRLIVPLYVMGFHNFINTSMLLAWICYSGIWRLFLLFNFQFPNLQKQLAISILFIPSVVFWGSGLLKDTITLSAVGWYTYHFYHFFIAKKYKISGALFIFISSAALILIKPYIFFAVLPGSLIWLSNARLKKIQSKTLRTVIAPLFIGFGLAVSFATLLQMGSVLGVYSLDHVLDKAVESNLDQKATYYGGSSFDIGNFDANIWSMLAKAHLAIAYALYGPFLWEVRNPVMLLSALENTYIMLLTAFLLLRLKIIGFFQLIGKHPLLLFSVLFSLFFAFSVGIATSNFGSLVRLKIPCIPFFVSSLFVLKRFYDIKTGRIKITDTIT